MFRIVHIIFRLSRLAWYYFSFKWRQYIRTRQAKNQFPTDTTHIVAIGLIVVVQVAVVEIHVQSVVSIVRISSRRPVVVRNGFYSCTNLISENLTLQRKVLWPLILHIFMKWQESW